MADYYFLIKEQITVWESQNVKPKVYRVIFFKAFHEEVFQGDFCTKRFDWPPDPSDVKKAVCPCPLWKELTSGQGDCPQMTASCHLTEGR